MRPRMLADYPFLPETKEYVKQQGITMDFLASDPKIAEAGFRRVEDAVNGIPYENEDPMTDITTFLTACLLLNKSKARVIVGKFALQEALRMEAHMEEDRQSGITGYILSYLFGTKVKINGNNWIIPVPNYIARCHRYGDKSWKLVNQTVVGGSVHIDPKHSRRLAREDMVTQVKDMVFHVPPFKAPATFDMFVEKLQNREDTYRSHDRDKGKRGDPPCIKHMINEMAVGNNLNDFGRFTLGVYMHQKGNTPEESNELYRGAPDYSERVTLYKLRHVAKHNYSCPGCNRVEEAGHCFPVERCRKIRNPIHF